MDIRKEQYDEFLQADAARFVSLIVDHLQQESPELVRDLPVPELREMVANGLVRARGHGLRADGDLMAFVSVMFETAPNFDEHPAIRRVLQDPSIPPNERLDAIFTRVPGRAWEEAEQRYDAGAWFPDLENKG